jgi:hypothetical protein
VPELSGEGAVIRFTTVTEIAASADRAFACVAEPARWPSFVGFALVPGIARGEPSELPQRAGTRIRLENVDGSRFEETVTAFEPGRRYAVRVHLEPPGSWFMRGIDETFDFEPTAAGSRLVRTLAIEPRGAWAAPLALLFAHLLLKVAVRRHDMNIAAAAAREAAA